MKRFITYMLFTLTLGAAVCAQAFPPQGISPDVMTQFKAPQWIQPRAETGEFVELSTELPMFQWIPPVLNGSPVPMGTTYDFTIVEIMPGQSPDQAIERNPVVYRAPGLITPQCLLPRTIVEALRPEAEYAAQIKTNVPHNRLANDGAGELLLFRLAKVEVKLHNEKQEPQ